MSREVVFRPQAEDDAIEVHAWYEARRAGLGREFGQAVDALVARIADSPFLFQRVQLIRSIELHLSIETTTAAQATGPEHFDWGLGSVVALFTADKRRYRFVSDLRVYDQQVAETRRRLRMVYSPETPPEILGQPISLLGSVDVLAATFLDILEKQRFDTALGGTVVECGVMLNGIPIGRVRVEIPPGQLNRNQANMAVASTFSQIPQAYRTATERR